MHVYLLFPGQKSVLVLFMYLFYWQNDTEGNNEGEFEAV